MGKGQKQRSKSGIKLQGLNQGFLLIEMGFSLVSFHCQWNMFKCKHTEYLDGMGDMDAFPLHFIRICNEFDSCVANAFVFSIHFPLFFLFLFFFASTSSFSVSPPSPFIRLMNFSNRFSSLSRLLPAAPLLLLTSLLHFHMYVSLASNRNTSITDLWIH